MIRNGNIRGRPYAAAAAFGGGAYQAGLPCEAPLPLIAAILGALRERLAASPELGRPSVEEDAPLEAGDVICLLSPEGSLLGDEVGRVRPPTN